MAARTSPKRIAPDRTSGESDFLRRGRARSRECIGEAQRLPLGDAERMVGQHLHAPYVRKRADERAEFRERRFVGVDARYEHVPDPDALADFRKEARAVEDVRVVRTRKLTMRRGVDVLQVKEQEVRRVHQSPELPEPRLFAGERTRRRINAGVDALLLRLLEKLRQKVELL